MSAYDPKRTSARAASTPRQIEAVLGSRRVAALSHGTQTTVGAFCSCSASSIKGGYYAFEVFGHYQRTHCDAGGHGCMGSKQYQRKDARSHYAKDAPGEEHRTGSIRICAWSPQAEVQVTISISIYAESQNPLIRRHDEHLYRIARSVLPDDHEAEDVVQESYIRTFTGLRRFRGAASLRTWLTRIVLNEAIRQSTDVRYTTAFGC
jgi:hypothetical protein